MNPGWSWLSGFFLYNEEKPMIFSTIMFWGFFAGCLLIYSFLYKANKLRNIYLLVISIFFYYKSGGYFFSILAFTIVIDYWTGILLGKAVKKHSRLALLTLSLIANLGVLAYFKYAYFITDTLNRITGLNYKVVNYLAECTNAITGAGFDTASIILPVGISFFTFQSMSYTIDVYRRKIQPVRSLSDFAFFVTFFPQLVAGPIVRATEFIPQLYKNYSLTKREFGYSVFLILNGLVKKMVISDYISVNFVDRVFDNPMAYTGFENLLGVYGYAIQIYCDFSGYTDIAIGVALILGFRLPLNFNSPYKAVNITDFWRRWHISLSTWLRDYLYISLGGNRKGKIRTYINLMITMLLGGLWHGANVKFIIWGGIHGIALAGHKVWRIIFPVKKNPSLFSRIAGLFITFNIVCLAWIFFRAQDMKTINQMFSQIYYSFGFKLIPEILNSYSAILLLISGAFIIHWLPSGFKEYYRGKFIESPTVMKVIVTVLTVVLIYQVKSSDIQPFIYFQF